MPTNKELVKQAQTEQLGIIANNRLTVLQSIEELESVGGKDDYHQSLRTIVNAYPEGVLLSKVQMVLTDVKVLGEARKALKHEIEEIGGKRIVLKVRKQPETQTAE
jgi:predicted RNA binding protein with dsRBD fold (UPF0201 family)